MGKNYTVHTGCAEYMLLLVITTHNPYWLVVDASNVLFAMGYLWLHLYKNDIFSTAQIKTSSTNMILK
jgi:hypothetical protein